MTQQWHLLVPELKQRAWLSPRDQKPPVWRPGQGPRTFLSDNASTWDAFSKLVRRSSLIKCNVTVPAVGCNVTPTVQLSPFERLPTELLDMILNDQDLFVGDITALGVCSKTLWQSILAHVHQDCKASASWAGTPLVCTGSLLTDLPPAICEKFFPDYEQSVKQYHARIQRWHGPCPARRWNWNTVGTSKSIEGQSPDQTWLDALTTSPWSQQIPPVIMEELRSSLILVLPSHMAAINRGWVLRNLTAQQYARLESDEPQNGQPAQVHVQGVPRLKLDQALVLRITWGTEDSYDNNTRSSRRKLLHGKWAGHSFDVVEDCSSMEMGEGWQDVTGELVKESQAWQ